MPGGEDDGQGQGLGEGLRDEGSLALGVCVEDGADAVGAGRAAEVVGASRVAAGHGLHRETGRKSDRLDGVGPREVELAVAGEVRLGVGGDPAEQDLVGEGRRVEAAGGFGGQGVAREDVADGVEGDGPPVVLLEVRLDGLWGAIGEEAEEVPGAVDTEAVFTGFMASPR